jgi:hypothetical protein
LLEAPAAEQALLMLVAVAVLVDFWQLPQRFRSVLHTQQILAGVVREVPTAQTLLLSPPLLVVEPVADSTLMVLLEGLAAEVGLVLQELQEVLVHQAKVLMVALVFLAPTVCSVTLVWVAAVAVQLR